MGIRELDEQLGIVPGSWLEIEADHGVLRASVIQPVYSESPMPSGLGLAGYRGRRLEIEEMDPVRFLGRDKLEGMVG